MSLSKRRVFEIFDASSRDDRVGRTVDIFIIALIVLNVVAVILESVPAVAASYDTAFQAFELASIAVFTVEYLVRLWSCTGSPQYRQPLFGRIRFMFTPFALVDLLAILPVLFGLHDMRWLRVLRLFKIGRYFRPMRVLAKVITAKRDELWMSTFVIIVLLIFASSAMHAAEHEAQPEAFSSIPAAMWWGVATLTTVGYGDVYPVTPIGRVLGAIIAVLGVGMFAIPAGILASGFSEAFGKDETTRRVPCPHCGGAVVVED